MTSWRIHSTATPLERGVVCLRPRFSSCIGRAKSVCLDFERAAAQMSGDWQNIFHERAKVFTPQPLWLGRAVPSDAEFRGGPRRPTRSRSPITVGNLALAVRTPPVGLLSLQDCHTSTVVLTPFQALKALSRQPQNPRGPPPQEANRPLLVDDTTRQASGTWNHRHRH